MSAYRQTDLNKTLKQNTFLKPLFKLTPNGRTLIIHHSLFIIHQFLNLVLRFIDILKQADSFRLLFFSTKNTENNIPFSFPFRQASLSEKQTYGYYRRITVALSAKKRLSVGKSCWKACIKDAIIELQRTCQLGKE